MVSIQPEKPRLTQTQRAIKLLVQEICTQLDTIAQLTRRGSPARISRRCLAEMCQVLQSLGDEERDFYYETLAQNSLTSLPAVQQKEIGSETSIEERARRESSARLDFFRSRHAAG